MMGNALKYRSLLTDTLPYEVPVIFSNAILHASLAAPPADPKIASHLDRLRQKSRTFSKPYSYDIAKGIGRTTTLSIIHPIWQILVAQFYEDHAASMLNYCADERFSLRRPSAVASPFMQDGDDPTDGRLKVGVAQLAEDAGEPNVTHLTTYFAYRKYNLLGKFADSREHQRLEMRFMYRRSLDISKCFYNIYTHSVTWAVKGKDFAKNYANTYTFEGELDSLFQRINYNETNGIVVGPEFSRIFAEIILQQVDRRMSDLLQTEQRGNLEATKDYDVRRYVDDYYIFANSHEVLDQAESALCVALEEYKLYLNTSKRQTYARPFVSDISLARHDIGTLVRDVRQVVAEMTGEAAENGRMPGMLRTVRSLLADIRLGVRKHNVKFENVSGWLLGKYRRMMISALSKASSSPDLSSYLVDVVASLVESSLYVCAVDPRVRTSYALCQLLELISEHRDELNAEQRDQIDHLVSEGLIGILRTAKASGTLSSADSVEAYNVLIGGSHFLGTDFTEQKIVRDIIIDLVGRPLTYFNYITAKFCLLQDKANQTVLLSNLNDKVEEFLRGDSDWRGNAEHFLLLSDFLSAPDVDVGRKRALFSDVVGGNPSKAAIQTLTSHVGFVDWAGLSVKHLLKRKTLRPVYAWS